MSVIDRVSEMYSNNCLPSNRELLAMDQDEEFAARRKYVDKQ